jgi:hypothetical protein
LSSETSEWVPVSESVDTGIQYAINSGSIYATPVNTGGIVVRFIVGHLISNGSTEMAQLSVDCQGGKVVENEHGVLNRNGKLSMMETTDGTFQITNGTVIEQISQKVCGYALTKMNRKASTHLGE